MEGGNYLFTLASETNRNYVCMYESHANFYYAFIIEKLKLYKN